MLYFRKGLKKKEPVYLALWAGPCDFDEVLISPVMIQDHMPDTMLKALQKVMPQSFVSQSSSVKYEPLVPEVLEEANNEGCNIEIADDYNFDDTHTNLNESNSFESKTTDSSHSTNLIVVDVEVHERKETQPGSN